MVAKMMNRQYLGFEIVKKYHEFAKERLDRNVYRLREPQGAYEVGETMCLFDMESVDLSRVVSKRGGSGPRA